MSSAPILVIGYGNEQRGDDALGPLVARAVASWELPEVQTIALHQLTPELAPILAGAKTVLFVDAERHDNGAECRLRDLDPRPTDGLAGHTADPQALLALADTLYGRRPRAWWLTLPAHSFTFGAVLSPAASRGMLLALRFLRDLLRCLRRL
jgi:hydrogenase maturation protease